MALEPEEECYSPSTGEQVGTLAKCQHVSLILDSEGGPPKGSSLALGSEDRKALPQPVPRDPLPHPAARNQEVRTGLSFIVLASGLQLFLAKGLLFMSRQAHK